MGNFTDDLTVVRPYLSVVVAARNDGLSVQAVSRMQIFLNVLAEQCNRAGLVAELIWVEWNPDPDRNRMLDLLNWPKPDDALKVRVIEVPCHAHCNFEHSDRLAFFKMHALNAGVRRARGEFVLSTNPYTVFSEGVIDFFGGKNLEHGTLYRADRHDVGANIVVDMAAADLLELCAKHTTRIHCKSGDVEVSGLQARMVDGIAKKGFFEPLARMARRVLPIAFGTGREAIVPLVGGASEGHADAGFDVMTDATANESHTASREEIIPDVHLGFCGDFLLMSRDDWWGLKGFCEWPGHPDHKDSLLCLCAYYKGIKEHCLQAPIYHIAPPEPEGSNPSQRAWMHGQQDGIPRITEQQYTSIALDMKCANAPTNFNTDDWGLSAFVLPERDSVKASSKRAQDQTYTQQCWAMGAPRVRFVEVHMFDTCTHKCGFCWFAESGQVLDSDQLRPFREPEFIDRVAAFFNSRTDDCNKWLLRLSGGEPLIAPNLEMLCRKLFDAGNRVAINTALFVSRNHPGFRFLLDVSAREVDYLKVSFHPEAEPEEDRFFAKVEALKRAGHNILVKFVAHPKRLHRLDELSEKCRKLGVCFYAGTLFSPQYPDAYTEEEKTKLRSHFSTLSQAIELEGGIVTGNTLCHAGNQVISVNLQTGNVTPCVSVNGPVLGNLFKDELRLTEQPIRCPGGSSFTCSCDIHYQQDIIVGISDSKKFAQAKKGFAEPEDLRTSLDTLRNQGFQFRTDLPVNRPSIGIGHVRDDSVLAFSVEEVKERWIHTKRLREARK